MSTSVHSWHLSIPVTVTLVLAGFVYVRGWIHLQTVFPDSMPLWRSVAFLCGLLCVWLATGSPLAALDEQLLTFHMVRHLLLMTIAPPLILLGSPMLPLRHGFPKFLTRGILSPFLRLALVQNFVGMLANPLLCWFAAPAVLFGWHFPATFEVGLRSGLWHHIQHLTFLAAGLLFWWPVVPSWPSVFQPRWSTVIYLFLATLPCDALSAFLVFCGRVVYSSYLDVPRHFDISPLQDQECAGALMWTCATFAYLIPAVIITNRLLSFSGDYERRVSQNDSEP